MPYLPRLELAISTYDLAQSPPLSIIIPAYNEANRLPGTLARLHGYLRTRDFRWEIIVVSNGSTDGTDDVARRAASDIPHLRLISIPDRGKGIASKTGALASKGDVVFLCDADLSMPPATLERFLEGISRFDIIVGSREAPGATRYEEPSYRHVMGRVFNWLVQLLAVPGIRDTQCGFKAFRRPAALDLFARLTVKGFGFDVELLFLARKLGYTYEELGIDWHFDADSRVRPGTDTLNMFAEVCAIRVRSMLGRYGERSASATAPGGDIVR